MRGGGNMAKSRREFLTNTTAALLGAAVASEAQQQKPGDLPAGTPPAFGTGPAVGPEVSTTTFAEAQKVVQVELTTKDREMMTATWRGNMAGLYERRTGPRSVAIEANVAPY